MTSRTHLATAIRFALAGSLTSIAMGAHSQESSSAGTLDTVYVSASAFDEDAANLAASYSILDAENCSSGRRRRSEKP